MKKLILTTLLCALCLSACSEKTVDDKTVEKAKTTHTEKTKITEEETIIEFSTDDNGNKYIPEYDDNNNLIKETFYDDNGTKLGWYEYNYDDKGNCLKKQYILPMVHMKM